MEMNHVLVVEDDKEIREGVEIYLKSQGYEVFQAADGVEGLEVIEKEDIHLAIVDIMMPRMDGISMVVKLREKYDFPVIFLSAKSEEVDKIMGLNMGADDYVTKPFTPMELLARVNSQLRRYRRFMFIFLLIFYLTGLSFSGVALSSVSSTGSSDSFSSVAFTSSVSFSDSFIRPLMLSSRYSFFTILIPDPTSQ